MEKEVCKACQHHIEDHSKAGCCAKRKGRYCKCKNGAAVTFKKWWTMFETPRHRALGVIDAQRDGFKGGY